MQDLGPIRGRAFGKDRDMVAPRQDVADCAIDQRCVLAAAPPQEHRVVGAGQPAHQRPMPDVVLGHEGGRQGGVDHEDVQPGNMVGHQHAARRHVVDGRFQAQPENLEQRLGPPAFDAQAVPGRTQRKDPGDRQQPL